MNRPRANPAQLLAALALASHAPIAGAALVEPTPPDHAPASVDTAPAEAPPPDATPAIGALPDDQLLHLSFTPFMWLTSFSGTTGAAGLKVDIDETFLDIVDDSDSIFGLMGALDLEYKRFVLQVNGTYSKAEFGNQTTRTPGPGGAQVVVDADLEIETGWYEAFAGYRFIVTPIGHADANARFTLDAIAGARITSMEVDFQATARETVTLPDGRVLEAGTTRGLDQNEGWVEPFVGAQAGISLDEHWKIYLRADVGGFDVDDSQFAWQTIASLGYRWQCDAWSVGLFGGYRALGQDYSRGGFTWDVVTHGPLLGASFMFTF